MRDDKEVKTGAVSPMQDHPPHQRSRREESRTKRFILDAQFPRDSSVNTGHVLEICSLFAKPCHVGVSDTGDGKFVLEFETRIEMDAALMGLESIEINGYGMVGPVVSRLE